MKINDFNVMLNLDMDSFVGKTNDKCVEKELYNAPYGSDRVREFNAERELYGDAADEVSVDSEMYRSYSRH